MRITYVGGLDRAAPLLKAEAERFGHELELVFAPNSRRQMAELESSIARSQLVIIVTELDSHNAMQAAKKAAKRLGVRCLLTRKLGVARFRQLLTDLIPQPVVLAQSA